ncbi:endonuclease domain-containing 1 protein-like isoform X1 [Pungitius pungitius]|uniref:endonuclease domain-containing 1 protein-like isoform X1 n=1 Tax=Pungitius pungitius TaxID=134920 RepID=UPI002E10DF2B
MFRLVAPAALLLLLLSIVPTVTEVVRSISECNKYFLDGAAPNIPGILVGGKILDQNRYKAICQTWNHERRFVTLYDTENKIPVFSAYKYQGAEKTGMLNGRQWKIEPQLKNKSGSKNMEDSPNETYIHQAGDKDYLNRSQKSLTRGHLLPFSYGSTFDDKVSTCTLTNAVPQEETFNSQSWSRMEKCVKRVLDKYCRNNNGEIKGYLVTGAQPGNITMNNRVNVPPMMWSAFCCQSHGGWLASAHWGHNEEEKEKDKRLETRTLRELELEIWNGEAKMFPGTHCPLNTRVSDLYPNLVETCTCPLHISSTSAPSTTSRPNYTLTAMSITTAYLLLVLTWSF